MTWRPSRYAALAALAASMGCLPTDYGAQQGNSSPPPEQAQPVPVEGGAAAGQTDDQGVATFTLPNGVTVTVSAVDQDGQPIAGIDIAFEGDAAFVRIVASDESGKLSPALAMGALVDLAAPAGGGLKPQDESPTEYRLVFTLPPADDANHFGDHIHHIKSAHVSAASFEDEDDGETDDDDGDYICLLPGELIRFLVEHRKGDKLHLGSILDERYPKRI